MEQLDTHTRFKKEEEKCVCGFRCRLNQTLEQHKRSCSEYQMKGGNNNG